MISGVRAVILTAIFFAGCQTAHDVAVTSFRVLDTPARFVRDRIDPPQTTTTTTTTQQYQTSDVTNPGEPVQEPPPTVERSTTRRRTTAQESRPPRPEPSPATVRSTTKTAQHKPTPSPSPRAAAKQTAQFPTARPVPGQPGHVYSIDPKGGIVDVTGYKKGDKAKDPYTQQIFIVP